MTTYTEEKGVQPIKELKLRTMFMKEGGYKRIKKNNNISIKVIVNLIKNTRIK